MNKLVHLTYIATFLSIFLPSLSMSSPITFSVDGNGDANGWYGSLQIEEFAQTEDGEMVDQGYIEDCMLLMDYKIDFYFSLSNVTMFDGNDDQIFINESGKINISLENNGGSLNNWFCSWEISDSLFSSVEVDVDFTGLCLLDYESLSDSIALKNGIYIGNGGWSMYNNLNLTKAEQSIEPVPEPSTLLLMALGIIGFQRRQSKTG